MPLASIDQLLRSPRLELEDYTDPDTGFIAQFQAIIAAFNTLPAGLKTYLDRDRDGSLGIVDLLIWLDDVMVRNFGRLARWPWAGADPMGLLNLHPRLILLDPTDTGAVELSTNVLNNTVTLPGGGTRDLWTGAAADQYNTDCRRWKKITPESGGTFRRHFVSATVAVDVIVVWRGGDHHYNETTLRRNNGSNPQCTRIDFIGVGEVVNCYNSNTETSTGSGVWRNAEGWTNTRSNVWRRNINWFGYDGPVGNRIFCTGPIWVDGADSSPVNLATESGMEGCYYGFHRGISPTHPLANTAPYNQLVDSKHDVRSPALTGAYQIYSLTCTVNDCEYRNNVFEFAPEYFPYVNSNNPLSQGHGDGLKVEGFESRNTSGVKIIDNIFKGQAPHAMILLYNADACTVTGNQVSATAHIGIATANAGAWNFGGHTIANNRVDKIGSVDSTVSGSGIEMVGTVGSDVYGNIVWCNDESVACPIKGLHFSMVPGQHNDLAENDFHHNISWRAGSYFGHDAGWQGANAQVHDNQFRFNVLVGRPDNNATPALGGALSYNTPLILNNGQLGTVGDDNTVTDNLIVLRNATYHVTRQTALSFVGYDSSDQGTWFVRNYTMDADDLDFEDPDNGDFRVPPNSRIWNALSGYYEHMLVVALDEDRTMHPYQYMLDDVRAIAGPVEITSLVDGNVELLPMIAGDVIIEPVTDG